jgi:cytosine/adenosine deaminase-related metal-dependent hydrolase
MAIRATRDIKRTFTVEDVRERAIRAALMASRAGTTALRTHVDVDPIVGLAGIRGVLEAREVCAGLIDIQIVAFLRRDSSALWGPWTSCGRRSNWARMPSAAHPRWMIARRTMSEPF